MRQLTQLPPALKHGRITSVIKTSEESTLGTLEMAAPPSLIDLAATQWSNANW